MNNLGILDADITEGLNWKTGKNFFSLLRSVFKLVSLLIELGELYRAEWSRLRNRDKDSSSSNAYSSKTSSKSSLVRKNLLISQKSQEKHNELHFLIIEAIMKIVMRINSLKLEPIFSYLSMPVIGLVGVIYSVCGLIKRLDKIRSSEEKKAIKYCEIVKKSRLNLNQTDSEYFDMAHNTKISMETFKKTASFFNFNKRASFDLLLSIKDNGEANGKFLLDSNYYSEYYIEFAKDFPTNPQLIFDYM